MDNQNKKIPVAQSTQLMKEQVGSKERLSQALLQMLEAVKLNLFKA